MYQSIQFRLQLLQILLSLTYRVLYGNKITELPKGVFDGLYALQLL